MDKIFGSKPKPDKSLAAAQRRQMEDAKNDRSALEAEKSSITGASARGRRGRGLLSSRRTGGLKSELGT